MLTFDEGDELFDFEGEKIKLVKPDQDFSVEVNCDEDQLIDEAAGKSTEKKQRWKETKGTHDQSLNDSAFNNLLGKIFGS